VDTSAGKVLVTGATGLVGRAVCPLLRSRGLRVRAALRRPLAPGESGPGDEQVTVGELGAHTDWSGALDGIDAVVHLAGLAHIVSAATPAQIDGYRRVNVEATETLARAAAERRVRRFVFASSARVLGDASPGRPWTERDAPDPSDEYARSKWQAEQRLAAIGAAGATEVVILRPPLVYGPGVKANFLRLLAAVERGLPIPLGAVRNRRSLLYVGNLADAIAACLDHAAAAGKTFFVSDGDDVSTPELIRRIALALGRKPRLVPVPLAMLRLGATLVGRREDFVRLTADFALDSGAIRAGLGWTPPYSMQKGLEDTARWYLSERAAAN
jgi:nucleoside-diphosphate-sugar epimerase